jgi:uncharacterized protein involved in response to NO
MHISNVSTPNQYRSSFLHLGFRPFFLGAAVFAVITMIWWMMVLNFNESFQLGHITSQQWHAHEMVFGYALAVIAGFLLTAVKNWTNVQTLHQKPLLGLFSLWVIARVLPLVIKDVPLMVVAIADMMFTLLLVLAIAHPLYKARAKAHSGIALITTLFLVAQVFFYLGAFGLIPNGELLGIYMGFYLILMMILVMGRRVIPFFIEKGVGEPVEIRNYRWVDISSIVLYVIYAILQLSHFSMTWASVIAALFVVVQLVRIYGWYTPLIWDKPLLWVLLLSYCSIIAGFLLQALSLYLPISPYITIHAFAVGGIALLTTGMMARVSIGHTGRNVFEPPEILKGIFLLLVIATITRVYLPILFSESISLWVLLSQGIWILAYLLFLGKFIPIWIKPRIDGRYG